MRAGCSIRLSTPPSDSASWKIFVRATKVDGLVLGLEQERDHPAEVAHLRAGDFVPRMVRQAGVEDTLDAGVPVEELGDASGVLAVLAHPYGERLDPAQHEPGVERPRHGAERLLQEVEPLGERVVVRGDEAADRVAVPAEILRRRVDDRVGAELERLLQVRRGKGVVDDEQRADGVRCVSGLADVDDVQQRVRRRLDPDELHVFVEVRRRGCRRTRSPAHT